MATLSSSKAKVKPEPYRVPKELDILPPRPVLFPWIPPLDALNACFGIQDIRGSNKNDNNKKRFSFDWSGKKVESSSQAGTPATLPLSPNNEDDEYEDAMPDMSRVDNIPERRRGKKQQQQKNQQLDTITDVIAEVFRVILFIISTRRAVLRQINREEQRQPQLLSGMTIEKSKSTSRQQNNHSSDRTIDIV